MQISLHDRYATINWNEMFSHTSLTITQILCQIKAKTRFC